MIFEIKKSIEGKTLIVQTQCDEAWELFEMMLSCEFYNCDMASANGFENAIIFD
jgi:hypothetical protein